MACSLLAAGLAAPGAALAQSKTDADVTEALKKVYGDNAKTQVVGSPRKVHGVNVYDVRVTNKEGDSTAQVTEYGDFLFYGEPRSSQAVSGPAKQAMTGLFKGQRQDVEMFRVSTYLVDIGAGDKNYRLRVDPVGRVVDIESAGEVKRDTSRLQKAGDADLKKIQDDVERRVGKNAKVRALYRSPEGGDFYVADVDRANGGETRITLNNEARVLSRQDKIKREELPPPVAQAIDDLFDPDKIREVWRDEYEYYQFEQPTRGGDSVTVKVRPNGDVIEIKSQGVREDENARGRRSAPGGAGDRTDRDTRRGAGRND
jgi:hypothetical protein